jgi:hypothetical protein
MKVSILNGRLIDPANGIDGDFDLHIAGGRVAALGPAPAGFHAERTIDAGGLVICPGLVDLCARLREPGGELAGFAVYGESPFEGRPAGILCDWLAAESAYGALLAWAAELAGERPLVAVLPPWCAEFRAFQDLGFRVRPTSLLLAGRSYDRRYDPRFWTRHWYYTMGDSDLC